MQIFTAAVWFIAGLVLIFSLGREHKVFYALGGFFLLLGAWWTADLFLEANLFAGAWGAALRIITLAALLGGGAVFFLERKRNLQNEKSEEKEKRETAGRE